MLSESRLKEKALDNAAPKGTEAPRGVGGTVDRGAEVIGKGAGTSASVEIIVGRGVGANASVAQGVGVEASTGANK
ncbi:unnamed protein product [Ilex paraguariensis]|uniref:Uncharacterized protein n=1 Tax=Ilex paraguariensis TaxID=185542 RepID=A0ABC8QWS5_9AQUA